MPIHWDKIVQAYLLLTDKTDRVYLCVWITFRIRTIMPISPPLGSKPT